MQPAPTDRDSIVLEARFDPRLETYFMLCAQFGLLVTFFGILLMPLWFLFGRSVHRRQYEALECELTARTLNFRKGFLFRVQKNVPLDKITDLSLKEGPILRHLGLCSLTVETAGGGAGAATGQAVLTGIVDAIEFRNAVLAQRDLVALGVPREHAAAASDPGLGAAGAREVELLGQIHESLGRIEQLLASKR